MEIILMSLEHLNIFAKILATLCLPLKSCTFLLKGDLGAGKTTFVRTFVQYIPGGKDAEVSSPSFNLYNIYPTKPETIHIDLYRCLDLEEEILEFFHNKDAVVFVEWCERIPVDFWPEEYILIEIKINNKEDTRTMYVTFKGNRLLSLSEQLEKNLKEQGLL